MFNEVHERTKKELNSPLCLTRPKLISVRYREYLYPPFSPGARFSKVPKLFGRISGDIILFVSSKQRPLEARNFEVILIFIRFTKYEKTSFTEQASRSFTNSFPGPKSFRDFQETCPWAELLVHRRPPSRTVLRLWTNATTYYLYLVQELAVLSLLSPTASVDWPSAPVLALVHLQSYRTFLYFFLHRFLRDFQSKTT